VCWQAAARGGGWAARIGLAVSLAAAVSLHFYAALLIVPPAIGELVRMVRRRRADWFTGLALVAGLAPLALYWPIIRTARSDYAAAFWSRATLESFPIFYKYLLEADLLPWIAALAVLAIFPATRALRSGGPVADVPTPVPEDVAVAAALALLPGLAVGLALLLGTAYTERYVVYAVVGLAILAATVLHQYGRGSPLLATVILAVLVGWLGPKMAQKYRRFEEARSEIVKLPEKLLEAADPKSPLVVANPLLYLRLTYYGPPELTERIVYVASPAHARRYLGFDTNDRALLALREWTPLRVVPLEDFTSSHPRFQIYESGAPEWLQTELAAKGARLDKAKHGMVNVTLPAKSASPPNP
jgi:hypothetical protein